MVKEQLHFILTEQGFVPERRTEMLSEEMEEWEERFFTDRYQALYDLSFEERPRWLDAAGTFLYAIADSFQRTLMRSPDLELARGKLELEPEEDELRLLSCSIPFVPGAEYVDEAWISGIFHNLLQIYADEVSSYDGSIALYLAGKSQQLKVPERIFFHLVEHEEDEECPFAFLATYATKIPGRGRGHRTRIVHKPLRYALTEYQNSRDKLLELLSCMDGATRVSPLIRQFVGSGEMFHPLRLTADEAWQFLRDVEAIEQTGIICRIPNWWRRHTGSVAMSVKLGDESPAMFGLESLISMKPELTVDGVPLTAEEIEQLLAQTEGLAFLKGRWIEVDRVRLQELLDTMAGYEGEITLLEALRMGLENGENDPDIGPIVTNGQWLSGFLGKLRSPSRLEELSVPETLHATLRPYQQSGYAWLSYMYELGLGACLADDMGLGKTIQILTFLENRRQQNPDMRVLLVVPASLLGNWQREAEKFTPDMPLQILHGGGRATEEQAQTPVFLTITTYGMTHRIEALSQIEWDCLILDEAQAIKNPGSKQTRQIKKLHSRMRIALTGTPIENDLTNLWSLFDFLDKGLLGGSAEFGDYCRGLSSHPEGYARLKAMISPFLLRRVKTDKSIISDLPDKMEQVDFVGLSRKQVVLYRKFVQELERKLQDKLSKMERRGLVLASLTRLKQICNHPDQYLGQEAYEEKDSGKFGMLREICETIYDKRERVLIFTQFKEIIPYLDDFLAQIFHHKGLTLHGGTAPKTRTRLVEQFQGDEYVPYMVISLKAGGTGLNLTKASHVIHFDRWWNPAVENQATDRVYRIGQEKRVIVHKLVCQGTIEERIDALLESKKELAENVIGTGGEKWISEMDNDELLSMLRLER